MYSLLVAGRGDIRKICDVQGNEAGAFACIQNGRVEEDFCVKEVGRRRCCVSILVEFVASYDEADAVFLCFKMMIIVHHACIRYLLSFSYVLFVYVLHCFCAMYSFRNACGQST